MGLAKKYLNTSHVAVNRELVLDNLDNEENLNTSHVAVNLIKRV